MAHIQSQHVKHNILRRCKQTTVSVFSWTYYLTAKFKIDEAK
jgi:hypothetical protein